MATIGSLAVNIVAQTDKFQKGLQQSKSMLGKFVQGISAAQAACASLAAVGFASVITSAIEAGGKIQELTQKLNISSEAITALHFAADQLESSAGAVDSALAKLNVTLGNAANGAKPAIAAFDRLGLNYQKLLALPLEQQFLAVVDALHKMPSAAEQASAAQAIFGKGAKEIMPLIKAGTDAIAEMGAKAAQTGAVISDDMVAALDDAGDAINAFSASWQGMKLQVVSVAAPAISAAMTGLTNVIKFFRSVWIALQAAVVMACEGIVLAVIGVEKVLNRVLPKFAEFNIQLDQNALEEFERKRKELANKADAIWGFNGQGQSPLKAPDSKEVAKNTATTNEKLDELIQVNKGKQNTVQLGVAGVR